MSECDYSGGSLRRRRPTYFVLRTYVLRTTWTFDIFIFFSKTAARITFKFGVEVPQVNVYQVSSNRGATPIF